MRLGHFQGPSKANNKEQKQKSSCAVSCLHSLAEPPGVRPHTCAERRGKGRRRSSKVGVWERVKEGQKVLLRLQASPVNS